MARLGARRHFAHRAALQFKIHDDANLRKLAALWTDDNAFFPAARQSIEDLEERMKAERHGAQFGHEEAWDDSTLRKGF